MSPPPRNQRDHESLINHYRVKQGLTIQALAKLAGVQFNTLVCLNNGTTSPLSPRGNGIKRSAQKIADALDVPLWRLWPRYFCHIERKKLTRDQVLEILHPESSPAIDWPWVYERVRNKRMFLVVRLRTMGYSLEQIGGRIGVTREYVRQIELSAIRRLKNVMCK